MMRLHLQKLRLLLALLALAACGTTTTPPTDGDDVLVLADAATDAASSDAKSDAATSDVALGELNGGFHPNGDVGATPPTVAWLAPANGATVSEHSTVQFQAKVLDPYLAPTDLALALTLTTGPFPNPPKLTAGADGTVTFASAELPPGPVHVVLLALDGTNDPGSATLDLFVAAAPDAPEVAILPSQPTRGDALVAVVTKPASDPDGSAVPADAYQYQWLHDGLATDVTAATLPAWTALPGETWQVAVRAVVNGHAGTAGTASVVVADQAPTPPGVALVPETPNLTSTLTCALVVPPTDADGDASVQLTYAWQRNGKPWPEAGTGATCALAELKGAAWHALLDVKTGDSIGCSVVASDGIVTLPAVDATPVTLLGYDVCASGLAPCSAFASCSNTDALIPACTCNSGYSGDGITCDDVDECAATTSPCPLHAGCSNSPGGFTCPCAAGYTDDGDGGCVDLNECASETACPLHSDCTNTDGGFACACQSGWYDGGQGCVNIDECAIGTLICSDVHAACTDLPGSATCTCVEGWTQGESGCVDLDECATPTTCGTNGFCTNLEGSFACSCAPGYAWDALAGCLDINECTDGSAICDPDATCQNSDGAYQCTCGKGYVGDGKVCDDVDECGLGLADCAAQALCTNTLGSYVCTCLPGWNGNGLVCTP